MADSIEGKLTCQKLMGFMKKNFDVMEQKLKRTKEQLSNDINQMNKQIIDNLVDMNKGLQSRVKVAHW